MSIMVRSDNSGGDRDIRSYNYNSATAPNLHIEYVVVTRPVANRLLFVVTSTSSPSAQETQRTTFFQDIGYTVTLIAASDSQASFDTAAAANDVAYISEDIISSNLNTKLKSKPLGIVNEEPALPDDFAVTSTSTSSSVSAITIATNNHFITSPFSTGSLTITSSAQPLLTWTGTTAPGLTTLATISGAPSLALVDAGGSLYDGTTAAGRRVLLPWSDTIIDLTLLTENGYNLLSRAARLGRGQGWSLEAR